MTLPLKWDPQGRPRKPGIVGIGAQKAGTSWLSQMLGQHPQVWTTPLKEVQFFNHRFIEAHRYWIAWHYRQKPVEIRARYQRRAEVLPAVMDDYLNSICAGSQMFSNHWYKQVFAPTPPDAQAMDVTPEYSTLPQEGVDFVARFLPRARFIYLVRDPLDRAISQLRMNLLRERRRPDSPAAWLEEIAAPVLADRGDYATYIPRWQARLGERLLILPYGDIARDPLALMRRLEGFLDLPAWDYRNLDVRVFATPDGIEVPEQARAALRERLAGQYAFLRDTMGADFLAASA